MGINRVRRLWSKALRCVLVPSGTETQLHQGRPAPALTRLATTTILRQLYRATSLG
jgi:hypothetical protein